MIIENATAPRRKIPSDLGVRNTSAWVLQPTVNPRNMVAVSMMADWAVFDTQIAGDFSVGSSCIFHSHRLRCHFCQNYEPVSKKENQPAAGCIRCFGSTGLCPRSSFDGTQRRSHKLFADARHGLQLIRSDRLGHLRRDSVEFLHLES